MLCRKGCHKLRYKIQQWNLTPVFLITSGILVIAENVNAADTSVGARTSIFNATYHDIADTAGKEILTK
jgi:hypothetical protein